jgi:hemerythrin
MDFNTEKITQILSHKKEHEYIVGKLREIIYELKDIGKSKEEIYTLFNTFHKHYLNENKIIEMDIIGDCLDMITGCYVGMNIEWD